MVRPQIVSILLTVVTMLASCGVMSAVTLEKLESEISKRLSRVEQFVAMKELAKEYGVKELYLFGGTASAWAHYVYWDLEREDGDLKYQPDRFDYDYTSVFRSNQDMDIVIDGTKEQAEKIERELGAKFPFFQGKKSVFEVRLLRESRGDKDAIVGNPDFLDQNTDSHSTGLIEIFGDGKRTILDTKEMDAKTPHFIKDVYERKLHYYADHLKHITTKRFKEGMNPEIVSVIRYLTKLFQYDLKMDPESKKEIERIIADFDPTDIAKNDPYVKGWLERNGTKLFQNAMNIEYAWNTLEKLGLRKKLIAVNNKISQQNSLSWWMNKEPLRSKPIGEGEGKTAKELGLDIVAHETNSFEAYESITKAHTGAANVLISRNGTVGENAYHGEGFYTRIGRKGAKNTGITIRFHLDPNAKEGTDFYILGDFIILKNKSAIRVIPESLTISPVEYFKKLAKNELLFDASDRAVQEKVRRKILGHVSTLSKIDELKIAALVRSSINSSAPNINLISEWFNLSISEKYPEFIGLVLQTNNRVFDTIFIRKFQSSQAIRKYLHQNPKLIDEIFKRKSETSEFIVDLLSDPYWKMEQLEQWLDLSLKSTQHNWVAYVNVYSSEKWIKDYPHLISKLLFSNEVDVILFAKYILTKKESLVHPEWVEAFLNVDGLQDFAITNILNNPEWNTHSEWIEKLMLKKELHNDLITNVLNQNLYPQNAEWITTVLKTANRDTINSVIFLILSQPFSASHPEWMEQLVRKNDRDLDKLLIEYCLSKPHWAPHAHFVKTIFERHHADWQIIKSILTVNDKVWLNYYLTTPEIQTYLLAEGLSKKGFESRPDLIEHFINMRNLQNSWNIATHILNKPWWNGHPELLEKLIDTGIVDEDIAREVFSTDVWLHHPELLAKLIGSGKARDETLNYFVFSKDYWANHPYFKKLVGNKSVSLENVKAAFLNKASPSTNCPDLIRGFL